MIPFFVSENFAWTFFPVSIFQTGGAKGQRVTVNCTKRHFIGKNTFFLCPSCQVDVKQPKWQLLNFLFLKWSKTKIGFIDPTKPVISLSLTQSAQTVRCIRTLKLAVKHLEFLHALWNIWSTVDENYSARGSNVFERASFLNISLDKYEFL